MVANPYPGWDYCECCYSPITRNGYGVRQCINPQCLHTLNEFEDSLIAERTKYDIALKKLRDVISIEQRKTIRRYEELKFYKVIG